MHRVVALLTCLIVLVGCASTEQAVDTDLRNADTTIAPDEVNRSATTTTILAPSSPSTTTAPGPTTSLPASTTVPAPLTFCRDLAADGDSFAEAVSWWLDNGAPDRMDADLDGLPCESVYPAADVSAYLAGLSQPTTGEPFPAALPRELIPWSTVGPGWYLTPFNGSDSHGPPIPPDYHGPVEPLATRPVVLYLFNDRGAVYEVVSWEGDTWVDVLDWRPDGQVALVQSGRYDPQTGLGVEIGLLDLVTGANAFVERLPLDALGYPTGLRYEFSRPTGKNLVRLEVTRAPDPNTPLDEQPDVGFVLTRHTVDGTTIATVFEARVPATEWRRDVNWLYHHDGGSLFVSDGVTLREVSNTGEEIRTLWTPADMSCHPVRWWDEATIVAACTSGNPDILPHAFYSQVWLLELGGTGRALTQPPQEEIENIGQHYGSYDASPTSYGALVPNSADCGGGGVALLSHDGSFIRSLPGGSLVGHNDGVAVTKGWLACDGTPASLLAVSVDDGVVLRTLIAAEDPIFGAVGQSRGLDPFVP